MARFYVFTKIYGLYELLSNSFAILEQYYTSDLCLYNSSSKSCIPQRLIPTDLSLFRQELVNLFPDL